MIFLYLAFIIISKFIKNDAIFEVFIYPFYDDITPHYSLLLRKKPPIRFYIYNISHQEDDSLIKSYIGNIQRPETISSELMFEYYIPFIIKNSFLYTNDPSEADIFLISTPLSFYYAHHIRYDELSINKVRGKYPYYNNSNGINFILLQTIFSCSKAAFTIDDEKNYPGMVSLGDLDWEYSIEQPRESIRNTIIPYASNCPFDVFKRSQNKSSRDLLLYFLGTVNLSMHHGSDIGKQVRLKMFYTLKDYPNSLFINTIRLDPQREAAYYGLKVQGYMRNSTFCLVPHGDSPSSKRFSDSIRSLCIPIILSDMIRFPFEDLFINYSKFIVQIPMHSPEKIKGILKQYKNSSSSMFLNATQRRKEMYKIRRMFNVNVYKHLIPGEQAWMWVWLHYIKLVYVISSMRRDLLKSKFL